MAHRYVHSGDEVHLIEGRRHLHAGDPRGAPDIEIVIVPIGGGSGAAGACVAGKDTCVRSGGDRRSGRGSAGRLPVVERREARHRRDEDGGRGPRNANGIRSSARACSGSKLDDFLLVSEDDIRDAVVKMIETTRNLVEAAGASPLAAASQLGDRLKRSQGGDHRQRRPTSRPTSYARHLHGQAPSKYGARQVRRQPDLETPGRSLRLAGTARDDRDGRAGSRVRPRSGTD